MLEAVSGEIRVRREIEGKAASEAQALVSNKSARWELSGGSIFMGRSVDEMHGLRAKYLNVAGESGSASDGYI
jgi:hypothetical protein